MCDPDSPSFPCPQMDQTSLAHLVSGRDSGEGQRAVGVCSCACLHAQAHRHIHALTHSAACTQHVYTYACTQHSHKHTHTLAHSTHTRTQPHLPCVPQLATRATSGARTWDLRWVVVPFGSLLDLLCLKDQSSNARGTHIESHPLLPLSNARSPSSCPPRSWMTECAVSGVQ